MQEVWTIERSLWLDGVEAYAGRLADECLMVFGPTGILQREAILETIKQAPRWASVEMTDTTLVLPTGSTSVIIAYRAEARREDGEPYRALCSSTYVVLGGELKLAQHQQTPL